MTDPWCLTWNKTKDELNCKSSGAKRFGISFEMYQFSLNLSFSVTVKWIFAINFHGNRSRLLMSFDLVSQSIKWKGLYLFHGHVNTLMLALHAEICVFDSRVLLKLIDAAHYWAVGQSSFQVPSSAANFGCIINTAMPLCRSIINTRHLWSQKSKFIDWSRRSDEMEGLDSCWWR